MQHANYSVEEIYGDENGYQECADQCQETGPLECHGRKYERSCESEQGQDRSAATCNSVEEGTRARSDALALKFSVGPTAISVSDTARTATCFGVE